MSEKSGKVEEKAFKFAKDIVQLVASLPSGEIRSILGKQLMRSGTSIGANIREAQSAESRKKEARESLYWLRLLSEFDSKNNEKLTQLAAECDELIRMLSAIVKTSQGR